MEAASLSLFDYFQIVIVAILLYAIIFGVLKKVAFFDDTKVNAVVAFLSAAIVSFSGVVTYTVSYAVNWFVIILFLMFVVILLLMFVGIKMSDITSMINPKLLGAILVVLFLVIFLKAFFALNNAFDTNEPQVDPYEVDPSFNTGVDDITNKEVEVGFFGNLFGSISTDVWYSVGFLIILGLFVMFIGG